jgi:hypothetical protein
MAVVYIHRRLNDDEVFYVGVGKRSNRAYSIYGRNKHWNNAVKKYGYRVEITHDGICYEEALSIEKYLVSFYGRADLKSGNLVNKTDGGDGVENPSFRLSGEKHPMYGKRHRDESRHKMSASQKGRKPMSEETKKMHQLRMSGEGNPMYGRTGELSPNYKRKFSDEHKSKISKAKSGKKMPNLSGENCNFHGLVGGRNYAARKVIDTVTGVVHECGKYAAESIGMPVTTLRNMLNGYRKNKTNLIYL